MLREDGSAYLPVGGSPISRISSQKILDEVVASFSSSAIYVWSGNLGQGGIFAQQLDTLGNQRWDSSDVQVSLLPLDYVRSIPDNHGGMILAGFYQSDFSIRVQQLSANGILGEVITDVKEKSTEQPPQTFILYQNYPNPFNPSTTFRYDLPEAGFATLKVYDLLGRVVQVLENGTEEAGHKVVEWDAGRFASGIYFYRLEVVSVDNPAKSFIDVRKLVLTK